MGIADLVPGISGGTIALLCGIYDEFIYTLSSFNKFFFKNIFLFRWKIAFEGINYRFLLCVFLGIFTSIIIFSRLIALLLSNYKAYTLAFFFGLIISSIHFLWKKLSDTNIFSFLYSFLGIVISFAVINIIPLESTGSTLFLFLCGMIAICAMILPGISGAFILLILGEYSTIITALKNPFIFTNFVNIAIFSVGALTGLLVFPRFLYYFLYRHYNYCLALLIGFLLGSLEKIWPWKTLIQENNLNFNGENFIPALNFDNIFILIILLIGVIIGVLLNYLGKNS